MLHKILETFKGSQSGSITETFMKGTTVDLSESLAAAVVPQGWAEPVESVEQQADTRSPAEKVEAAEQAVAAAREELGKASRKDRPAAQAKLGEAEKALEAARAELESGSGE